MSIKTDWFRGYTAEQTEERRKEVKDFKNAFDELLLVLKRKCAKPRTPDFEQPNWNAKTAYEFGKRDMLDEIIGLVNLEETQGE